ncbi:MAG: hypothetical protein O2934_02465, partial [Bacteroidetes bacterium]|nr:hypothetical protein [Bacteroidota bacterium]
MKIIFNAPIKFMKDMMKMRFSLIGPLFLGVILISCGEMSERERAIQAIDLNVRVERFDRVFAQASPDDLDSIKRAYPLFFPTQYPDSVWI